MHEMIWSAGDLGIQIDFGNDKPGAILQRKEKAGYHDYLVDVDITHCILSEKITQKIKSCLIMSIHFIGAKYRLVEYIVTISRSV